MTLVSITLIIAATLFIGVFVVGIFVTWIVTGAIKWILQDSGVRYTTERRVTWTLRLVLAIFSFVLALSFLSIDSTGTFTSTTGLAAILMGFIFAEPAKIIMQGVALQLSGKIEPGAIVQDLDGVTGVVADITIFHVRLVRMNGPLPADFVSYLQPGVLKPDEVQYVPANTFMINVLSTNMCTRVCVPPPSCVSSISASRTQWHRRT